MSIWSHCNNLESKLSYESCPYCNDELITLKENPDEVIEYFPDQGIYSWTVNICNNCGWWHCLEPCYYSGFCAVSSQHSTAEAQLKNIDIGDFSNEVSEIKEYIRLNWEKRNEINPRMMEHLVGDIFENSGYRIELTSYQKDGGIDLYLMSDGGKICGVQVKRTVRSIGVEQIRAFTGALVLRGVTSGVFVTTSKYTKPSIDEASLSGAKGYPIELLDADKLYDFLELQREIPPPTFDDWKELNHNVILHQLEETLDFVCTD